MKNAAPDGGIKRATVKKGDSVALVVHSDVEDEVHLHGYNFATDVARRCVGKIDFVANVPGPVRGRARAARRQDRRPHRHPVSSVGSPYSSRRPAEVSFPRSSVVGEA